MVLFIDTNQEEHVPNGRKRQKSKKQSDKNYPVGTR
jgi:hypothetical protein